MIWEKIRGHSHQVDMFRRAAGRGRLSHAYLFVGPEGIGKRMFAQALAQCLFCDRFDDTQLEACGECPACRQMLAGTHPDFLTVCVPEGKSELPIDLLAGPIDRRGREGLCYDLSLRPMSADRKVAVIDDTDRMNDPSANSLLKTLEEPPTDSILILISTNPDGLLPTIRSRCQQVRFAPLPTGDLAELLLDLGMSVDRDDASAAAAISEGSIAVAAQLLNPALRQLRDTLYDQLARDEFNSLQTADELVSGLDQLGGDAKTQRTNAGRLIRLCMAFFHSVLRQLSGHTETESIEPVRRFCQRFQQPTVDDWELVIALFDRTALAETQLDRRTPVPLCLHGLFDELGRIMRSATRV